MFNFAVFEWKDRRWPIQLPDTKLLPVTLRFRGGFGRLFPSCLCTHAVRPRALSLRKNNEVERYASSLPPFVSVSPIEWYVYTPVPNELSINLFEKVCCAIERAKFLHSATPRPYPWHTSFYRALPRCFRSYF